MAKTKWKTNAQVLAYYRPQAQRAVNRALLVGEGVAKVNAPVARVKGGTLRRSIHVEPDTGTETRPSAQLGSSVTYAKWQEIGSNGRPGKFFLAKGLQAARAALPNELKAIR